MIIFPPNNPLRRGIGSTHGFTLIELMIVLTVVAILAAVAYPSYQEQIRSSRRAEARASLLQMMLAQEKFFTQFNRYSTDMTAAPFRPFSSDRPQTSYYTIRATPCDAAANVNINVCVQLHAEPGAVALGGKAFSDPGCGILSLGSTGARTASGTNPNRCWN